MVDERLLNYIQDQLARGNSVQDVKNFLLQKGYQGITIDECLSYIYQDNQASHYKKSSLVIILIFIIVFAMIGALAFFLFQPLDKGAADVSLEIEFKQTNFDGEIIVFSRKIINKGRATGIPVEIEYQVKAADKRIVFSLDEDLIIYNDNVKEMSFILAGLDPGRYSLHATVLYDTQQKTRTASFVLEQKQAVNPKEDCFDGIKNNGETGIDCGGRCEKCKRQCPIFYDDNDHCTKDICSSDTDFHVVHEDIVPCCGNNICEEDEKQTCSSDCKDENSYFNESVTSHIHIVDDDMPLVEKIEMIKEMAKTDIQQAGQFCNAIVFPYYRDECFYEIAQIAERQNLCDSIAEERTKDKCYTKLSKLNDDSDACAEIQSELRRDSCYMGFALKGDYSVCSKIKDEYYLQSCRQLEIVGSNTDAS